MEEEWEAWRKEGREEGNRLAAQQQRGQEARERVRGFGYSSNHDAFLEKAFGPDGSFQTRRSNGPPGGLEDLIHNYKGDVSRDIQMVQGHVDDLWKGPDKPARTFILILMIQLVFFAWVKRNSGFDQLNPTGVEFCCR